MKPPAYLFGPFVGDLSWEFFRFAPFLIYTKKQHPDITTIVFTRESNFDLYGDYANILVPLRIPNDNKLKRDCFKLESLMIKDYNRAATKVKLKYKRRYEIIDHYYPDISLWRYKVKWQFPRRMMDYDFKPRRENKQIARRLVKHNNIIVDNIAVDYQKYPEAINTSDLVCRITNLSNGYDSSTLGTIIECLRICRFVVGNLDSYTSRLAILLKKPLICLNNKMSIDAINLLNPLKTPIIFADNITEGIEKWK